MSEKELAEGLEGACVAVVLVVVTFVISVLWFLQRG